MLKRETSWHLKIGFNSNMFQSATVKEKKRNEIWKKTQKRFNKLQVPEVFKHVAEDSEEDDKTWTGQSETSTRSIIYPIRD